MTPPVDLLAVIDAAIDREARPHEAGLHEARAAAADLILALELSDAWIREASHQGVPRATATLERNRAALARVKGGAA